MTTTGAVNDRNDRLRGRLSPNFVWFTGRLDLFAGRWAIHATIGFSDYKRWFLAHAEDEQRVIAPLDRQPVVAKG